ncbi:hypothetical protein VTH82DRAFT_6008 [Thermothelomyces myriococcoides]
MGEHCNTCKKAPPEVTLKRCTQCFATFYCSRDCQKADWKVHKKVCGKGGSSGSRLDFPRADKILSPAKGVDQPIDIPFTCLEKGTWLHNRPEKDVYRLLIDAYRLRADDIHNIEGRKVDLYAGKPDGLHGFRLFIQLAGERPGLLPPWWNDEKQRECEAFGMDETNFQNLRRKVDKGGIIKHYGDQLFPMQLRMFAEAVYGRGVGGQDGAPVRQMFVDMEQGNTKPDDVVATIDALTGNIASMSPGGGE